MKERKYLTKSRFKVGLECPRKLYYLDKDNEYANDKMNDPFLEALARGGYQVGELAKLDYPNGIEILDFEHIKSAEKTKVLMEQEKCIIFEAAFLFPPFFVKSDIVIKNGNHVRLIEVKSKTFIPNEFNKDIWNSRAGKGVLKLKSDWINYIYDVAFQTYVAKLSYPNLNFTSWFKAVDKTKTTSVDGLNSLFLIKKGQGKGFIVERQGVIKPDSIGTSILAEVDITSAVNDIIEGKEQTEFTIKKPFIDLANELAIIYLKNYKYPSDKAVSSTCKKCEFRTEHQTLKSGFNECWVESLKVKDKDVTKPFVFDIGRFSKGDELLSDGIYLMEKMNPEDIKQSKEKEISGFLQSDRQRLQVLSVINKLNEPTILKQELKDEILNWIYPFHFIDFETCAPALPFTKNRRPYENVAFQFSHHILYKNGTVEHVGEFINLTPGNFPNFEFVRELKRQLEKDNGSIFRYSHHENTVLNQIVAQLNDSQENDKKELIDFIRTITNYTPQGAKDKVHGPREMIDLCEMVTRFYYSPLMGGSVSIKYVLPSVLNESKFLQDKYSKPIYGTSLIKSKNFQNHTWVHLGKNGEVKNPYSELPLIFSLEEMKKIDYLLMDDEEIRNGGAAMMAYCMSQFTKMSEKERSNIQKALLRYCELDTLAMVMIVEYWINPL